jgi:WD40 repeat protein
MTDKDWEAFVDILEVHPDKKELWKFFYNAPVIWSKRLLDKLSKAAFKGFNQDEKSTLSNLFDLVKNIKDEEFMAAFLYLFIREPEYKIIVNPTTLINYRSPTISPNGKMLALSTGKKEIILLSLPDGNQIQTLTVPSHIDSHIDIDVSWLTGLIFSHDNRILISRTIEGSNIYLWSLQDGNDVKILSGHTKSVNSLVISNDGKMLLSGGYDGTVILWSLPSGTLIEVIPMSYSEYNGRITLIGNDSGHVQVRSLAISSDDQFLVVGTNINGSNIIILYDLLNRKYLKKIDPEMDYKEYFIMVDRFATVPFGIDDLLTNKNNNLLVSYGHSRRDHIGIAIFSLPNIKFERILIWQNSSKNFSTEKPVLCKSDVPSERTNGSNLKEDVTYTSIENCAISPNGQLLVSNITINSRNNNNIEDISITLFCSLPDGKLLKTIIGHQERFVISPNGKTLISVRSKFLSSNWEYTICLCNLSDVDTPLSKFTTQDISKIEEIRDSTMKPSVRNALEFTLSLIRLKQQFDIDIEDASSDVQFSEFDIEIDG